MYEIFAGFLAYPSFMAYNQLYHLCSLRIILEVRENIALDFNMMDCVFMNEVVFQDFFQRVSVIRCVPSMQILVTMQVSVFVDPVGTRVGGTC